MKKLLFVAAISFAGMSFAKSNVEEKNPIQKESIVLKKDVKNDETFDITGEKDNKKDVKVVNFPITFCDDYGCETMEVDTSIYSMNDVLAVIMWWLVAP
ncbi:MAG: hypothetical protein JNN23_18895 [Chryseobacterium gambrini]|nr:hypothetical protein [Chryseobacterium gambrini]